MNILNELLNSVGAGLAAAIGDESAHILMSLNDPDDFDSRDDLGDALFATFGSDLSTHFDRKTLSKALHREAKTADDKASDAMIDEEDVFVTRAMEIFGEVRDDVLDASMHELLKNEFGEGIRRRNLPNINALIRAAATGEDAEADEGLIPDDDELAEDPPLTDDLDDEDLDEDEIAFIDGED